MPGFQRKNQTPSAAPRAAMLYDPGRRKVCVPAPRLYSLPSGSRIRAVQLAGTQKVKTVSWPSCSHADVTVLYYYMLRSSTFDRVFWNQLPSDSLMAGFFRLSLNHKQHAPYLHFQTGGDAEIARLLEQIAREFTNPEPYGEQLMNALMSVFFVLLLRRYEGTARLPRTKEFQWKHEFSAIFSYIQQHYADRTLAQVAAEFHYSERQLSRIVETATGESYAQLTRRLRMERAAALLKLRELRLETVSETCGYASVPSFSRAFQDWYGTTPAKYRREQS